MQTYLIMEMDFKSCFLGNAQTQGAERWLEPQHTIYQLFFFLKGVKTQENTRLAAGEV